MKFNYIRTKHNENTDNDENFNDDIDDTFNDNDNEQKSGPHKFQE